MSKQKNTPNEESGSSLFEKLLVGGAIVVGLLSYGAGLLVQTMQAQEAMQTTDEWAAAAVARPLSYNPITNITLAFTTPSGLQMMAVIAVALGAILLLLKFTRKDSERFDDRNFTISDKGTYGTSGWMTPEELSEVLSWKKTEETDGTILGIKEGKAISLPLNSRLNKHTAIYGASGTGKSRSFVRPQILQCVARRESVIVTDPKGEIYADAAEYMKANGYDVKVFNLVDPTFSDSWNCLGEVMAGCLDEDGRVIDETQLSLNAQTFCDVIIKNTSNGKSDHFWDNSELSLLKALVLYVCMDEEEYATKESKTIGAVYNMLTNSSMQDLTSKFTNLPIGHPAKAPWDIYLRAGDTVKGNVVIGLGTRLQVFQAQNIRDITGYDEISLELPARKPCGYFVIMSDQNSTLDFLSSLFFSFLFIRLVKYADVYGEGGKCDVPVNFILDEFPNIGQIPDFTKKLSTIRSRELRVAVIFQNIAQLQNRYPLGLWEEIIGNCDTQLFLGCTDQTTAKFISERTGEMTIEVNSTAVTRDSISVAQTIPNYKETESVGKRYVLTPDEVMRLGSREALILIRGQKVLKAEKFDYTLHPRCGDFIHGYVRDHVPKWREEKEARNREADKIRGQEEAAFSDNLEESGELDGGAFPIGQIRGENTAAPVRQPPSQAMQITKRHASARRNRPGQKLEDSPEQESVKTPARKSRIIPVDEFSGSSPMEDGVYDLAADFADLLDL